MWDWNNNDTRQGIFTAREGEFWLCNQERGWALPLAPGTRFEAWVSSAWQAVEMHSGGYRGRYLLLPDGQRVRPALCMHGRLLR